MKNNQSITTYLFMLFVPLFWGGAFVAAEHVITEIPPVTAATVRFGAAGILLFLFILWRKKLDFKAFKKQWKAILLMALTGIFGYNIFFFTALDMTSAINGSLIMATTPVFVTVGAVLFLGETWNRQLGFGLILSLIGVMVVIAKGSFATFLALNFNAGDLLFIGGLICWVSHGLLGKIVMRDVSPIAATTWTTLIGSVFLAFWSLFENGWSKIGSMSQQAWGEMLFMIVCSSVIGFLLWNSGIKRIGASKSSIYMNFVPINTAWLAVVLYDSVINWTQIIGMIMVITGVCFVTMHTYIKNKLAYKRRVNDGQMADYK